jgi:hypothetical protein
MIFRKRLTFVDERVIPSVRGWLLIADQVADPIRGDL